MYSLSSTVLTIVCPVFLLEPRVIEGSVHGKAQSEGLGAGGDVGDAKSVAYSRAPLSILAIDTSQRVKRRQIVGAGQSYVQGPAVVPEGTWWLPVAAAERGDEWPRFRVSAGSGHLADGGFCLQQQVGCALEPKPP